MPCWKSKGLVSRSQGGLAFVVLAEVRSPAGESLFHLLNTNLSFEVRILSSEFEVGSVFANTTACFTVGK